MNAFAPQPDARKLPPQAGQPLRIGIVGGGPGGLMTAYLLQKKLSLPVCLTLWEASQRLGGKIHTLQFDSAPVSYEAGAAEFYDYSATDYDALKELITELGLAISPMGGNSVMSQGRLLSNLDDVSNQLGAQARKELESFDALARTQVSPVEFYGSQSEEGVPLVAPGIRFQEYLDQIREPQIRRYIETLIHSDLAAEPSETNVTYGLHNYLMNDCRYLQLYGIVGGNEQLVSALALGLNADVQVNSRVRRIETHQDETHPGRQIKVAVERLEAATPTAGKTVTIEHYELDYLVLALPLNGLKQLNVSGPQLSSALDRHIQHFDHPAHYLRISILFERPFWNGLLADSFCMLEDFGGCCLYDESSRVAESAYGVLGWLLGGATALKMADLTDPQLIELALNSLPTEISFGRSLFVEGKVHRWIGCVNAMPGGPSSMEMDRRHVPEPQHHPHLFVVGDYLFDSTINGVLESADYVSDWIAAKVNIQLPSQQNFLTSDNA